MKEKYARLFRPGLQFYYMHDLKVYRDKMQLWYEVVSFDGETLEASSRGSKACSSTNKFTLADIDYYNPQPITELLKFLYLDAVNSK